MLEGNNNMEVVIYKNKTGDVSTETFIKNGSIWLNQTQLSELFGIERSVITKHLNNIFKVAELRQNAVCAKIAHTASDGKTYKTMFYNLDAIISVGYRSNSKRATEFRIWATSILRSHILDGYTLNQRRLLEIKDKQLSTFEQAVSLIKKTIDTRQLSNKETEGILRVIADYSNSWVLLQKYDQEKLLIPAKNKRSKIIFTYDEIKSFISELKNDLVTKKEASDLFGHERESTLRSIIGNIHQSFDGKELYPSIEERAAHLLYFVIKDHPFSDGNKRIASFLFIVFLARQQYLFKKNGDKKINDNTLVAIALLVAESDPKQKDIMIKLIINFLVE